MKKATLKDVVEETIKEARNENHFYSCNLLTEVAIRMKYIFPGINDNIVKSRIEFLPSTYTELVQNKLDELLNIYSIPQDFLDGWDAEGLDIFSTQFESDQVNIYPNDILNNMSPDEIHETRIELLQNFLNTL
jgi:hypothetical protein